MTLTSNFCGECGTSLNEKARFCGECGAQVSDVQSNDQNEAEIQKRFPSPAPPSGGEKISTVSSSQSQPHKQPPPKTAFKAKSAPFSIKVGPLLSWSTAWGLGWLLLGIMLSLFYYNNPAPITRYALPGMTGGLIAAVILQWTGVSQHAPTLKMAALIVGAWIFFGGLLMLPDLLYMFNLPTYYYRNDVLPCAGVIAALLAWMVLKKGKKDAAGAISGPTRMTFLAGWAFCGIFPMFLWGPLAIAAFLLTIIAISVFVFINRI